MLVLTGHINRLGGQNTEFLTITARGMLRMITIVF